MSAVTESGIITQVAIISCALLIDDAFKAGVGIAFAKILGSLTIGTRVTRIATHTSNAAPIAPSAKSRLLAFRTNS